MNHKLLTIAVFAGLLAAGRAAAQDDTNAPPSNDYKSFQIIASRNVFNPNRRGPRPASIRYTPARRVDSFTLVGTMSDEKGQFAFFISNSSEYHKTLNVGQSIAGYKIAEIAPEYIKLAAASNRTINLPVGTQMRRPEGGRWSFAGRAEPVPVASGTNPDATTPATPDGAAPALPPGPESDAMKRLMLKRLMEK